MARSLYLRSLKAFIDAKAEHKGIACRQTPFHLAQGPVHPAIVQSLVLHSLGVTGSVGLFLKRTRIQVRVCPHGFGAYSLLAHALYAVADHRAIVERDCSLHRAFVVIDEKPRRYERLAFLFHLIELNRGANCVCSATAQVSLVVNRRTLAAQINGW